MRNRQPSFHKVTRRSLMQAGVAVSAWPWPTSFSALAGFSASNNVTGAAKRIVFLSMNGGPGQIDTFDPKPALDRLDGKTYSGTGKIGSGNRIVGPLWKSPFPFQQHGESGLPISELFPHVAQHADDLCVIRSMQTASAFHGAAMLQMNTGRLQLGSPSLGAWVAEGVGQTDAQLPDFVVMPDGRGVPIGGAANWSARKLSAKAQATVLTDMDDPIPCLNRPTGVSERSQQRVLNAIERLNASAAQSTIAGRAATARQQAFALARHMQSHASEAFDIGRETRKTQQSYGLDQDETRDFGTRCLVARRLLQRGVRFVQIYSGSGDQSHNWDGHTQHVEKHRSRAFETDQPIAALLADLQATGLWEDTVVVWGGEFGRTPTVEGSGNGRDHNPHGFSIWLAGAGIRSGHAVGATDDVGYKAVEKPYQVSDLHATLLHMLGLDHETFVRAVNGIEHRLTGPEPCQLISEVLG